MVVAGPTFQIQETLTQLNEAFDLRKPHRDVAFTMALQSLLGVHGDFETHSQENTWGGKRDV